MLISTREVQLKNNETAVWVEVSTLGWLCLVPTEYWMADKTTWIKTAIARVSAGLLGYSTYINDAYTVFPTAREACRAAEKNIGAKAFKKDQGPIRQDR